MKKLIILILFSLPVLSFGISKEELFTNLSINSTIRKPYQVSMKISMSNPQGLTLSDSGIMAISPDGKYYIQMTKEKTEQWGNLDTLWQKSVNGQMTKKISNANRSNQFSEPNVSELLKDQNLNIIKDDTAGVLIETETMVDNNQKLRMQLLVSKKTWNLVRSTAFMPNMGAIETGYQWQSFSGASVIKEIATVMPMGGFMKVGFSNYKVIDKIPDVK